MKKVLVIGASGLVGSAFVESENKKFEITPVDEKTVDITNQESISEYLDQNKFEVIINLAAFTDVAGAENQSGDETGLCWKLNVLAPKYLSEESEKRNIFLIHFSTDFVFEGLEDDKGPFVEDKVLPQTRENLSWYGWTKLLGEKEILKNTKNAAIVRIAYPFTTKFEGKTDWARKIIELYDSNSLYPMFEDQIITPILIDDLVSGLSKIVELETPGSYHLASSDSGSYYEIASYLLEKTRGVKNVIQKSSLVEFLKTSGRNKRPIFGGLSVEKTQEKLVMKFRTWREMIDDFANKLRD